MTKKQFRALKAGDTVWFVFDGQQYDKPPHVRTGTVLKAADLVIVAGMPKKYEYYSAHFVDVPYPDSSDSELSEKYVTKNGFLTKAEAMLSAAKIADSWTVEFRKMAMRFEIWARRLRIRYGAGRPSK